MSDQMQVNRADLDRFSNDMHASLDRFNAAANAPSADADAGRSTGLLAEWMSSFFDVVGGMAADIDNQAGQVNGSGSRYEQDDQAAASGLPPLPLANNDGGT